VRADSYSPKSDLADEDVTVIRQGFGLPDDSGRRWGLIVTTLVLALLLVLAGARSMRAAEFGVSSQCVTCHTDAAKLKALTPPDPPSTEEGEG
jgi:hypothetical protein